MQLVALIFRPGWRLPTMLPALLGLGVAVSAERADAQSVEASAEAQTSFDDDDSPLLPVRLDGHGALTWNGSAGVGLRVDVPIMEQGIAFNTRDQLSLTFGVDFMLVSFSGSNSVEGWPSAGVQWTLGVSDEFAFYPELGLAALIDDDGWRGVYPNIGFGGRYYLYRSVAIMGRLGWPMALSAGVTF